MNPLREEVHRRRRKESKQVSYSDENGNVKLGFLTQHSRFQQHTQKKNEEQKNGGFRGKKWDWYDNNGNEYGIKIGIGIDEDEEEEVEDEEEAEEGGRES